MHRSRIGLVLIDHAAEHYDDAVSFWAGAQGVRPVPSGDYTSVGEVGGLSLELQRLGEGSARVHLDIETDDVEAEVTRLLDLGATIAQRRDGYVVMTDPGGLVFCVVPIQTGDRFVEDALEWP